MQNVINRAISLVGRHGVQINQQTLAMDLFNSGVNFDALEKMSDADFAHDIFGIISNMNRQTRTLENCFVPRSGLAAADTSSIYLNAKAAGVLVELLEFILEDGSKSPKLTPTGARLSAQRLREELERFASVGFFDEL